MLSAESYNAIGNIYLVQFTNFVDFLEKMSMIKLLNRNLPVNNDFICKNTVNNNAKTKIVPKLLLAHTWEKDIDPTDYWMSEKLDGVRALWNTK